MEVWVVYNENDVYGVFSDKEKAKECANIEFDKEYDSEWWQKHKNNNETPDEYRVWSKAMIAGDPYMFAKKMVVK